MWKGTLEGVGAGGRARICTQSKGIFQETGRLPEPHGIPQIWIPKIRAQKFQLPENLPTKNADLRYLGQVGEWKSFPETHFRFWRVKRREGWELFPLARQSGSLSLERESLSLERERELRSHPTPTLLEL